MNKFESLRKTLEDKSNYTDLLELVEVISYNSFYLDWLIVTLYQLPLFIFILLLYTSIYILSIENLNFIFKFSLLYNR